MLRQWPYFVQQVFVRSDCNCLTVSCDLSLSPFLYGLPSSGWGIAFKFLELGVTVPLPKCPLLESAFFEDSKRCPILILATVYLPVPSRFPITHSNVQPATVKQTTAGSRESSPCKTEHSSGFCVFPIIYGSRCVGDH